MSAEVVDVLPVFNKLGYRRAIKEAELAEGLPKTKLFFAL